MSQSYFVNLFWPTLHEVSKSEFDRLRAMTRLFTWKPNKPKRLTLKREYVAWQEGTEWRFQEKATKRITRYVPSPEDSAARVERICGPLSATYIRDPIEMDREIQRQYS